MINNPRPIELLVPAKNADIGIAAIDHGADAVYIGPPQFGARAAASNSIEDIQRLVEHAHKYYAKVYVTLNTILVDSQLEAAQQLIHELYKIDVDALIIQDMSILQMDIPPIELHASTQCNTRSAEDVSFLENCGFQQIVLARESSLEQMQTICKTATVRIEAFIHGALCVCYSGQCYLSEASRQRSANRGACAQMCRLPYDLIDGEGTVWQEAKHLLSLKDFDGSKHLESILDAGVSSLKVEGRLKDIHYVKNITSYYREQLDALFARRPDDYKAASSGKSIHSFIPNPQKTFYRGATDYFLTERTKTMQNIDTPKSLGEPVGRVKSIFRTGFTLNSSIKIANGDGFCYMDNSGKLNGFRINRVQDRILIPLTMPQLEVGQLIYRNQDIEFEKELNGKSSDRKIDVTLLVTEHLNNLSLGEIILSTKNSGTYDLSDKSGKVVAKRPADNLNTDTNSSSPAKPQLHLVMQDSDGVRVVFPVDYDYEVAKNEQRAKDTFEKQFSKLGATEFSLTSLEFDWKEPWFIPASILTDMRRKLILQLQEQRRKSRPVVLQVKKDKKTFYGNTYLDYRGNVSNNLAKNFYLDHGVKEIKPAYELRSVHDAELMRCKYCIRFALGWCKKERNSGPKDPLFLVNGNDRFSLEFDCHNCEMVLKMSEKQNVEED